MFKLFFIQTILLSKFVLATEVNLYTSRHYDADTDLYKIFEKKTGIKVNILSGTGKILEKRILEEGKNCQADIFIAADAGNLGSAESKGLFKKIDLNTLNKKIPEVLRSDFWYPIAKRARVIFYNAENFNPKDLENIRYEDLSSPIWKNKIAIRQSNNIYNQSLVASIIENNGVEKTKIWLRGFVGNFSREPRGNDRSQILSVASGESQLAIANTYYYGLMLSGQKGENQKAAAKKVKVYFPNQNDRGVHINVSGGGILKYSPNTKNAVKLLEFLLEPEAQSHIVNNTFEYPIINGVKPHKLIRKLGLNFKEDRTTSVKSFKKFQSLSLQLMTDAGWN